MNILIAIIGSSAFTAVVTILFNFFQNRKHNLLSYITEDRKLWREKIRLISEGIEKCKFNDGNISQYLVQLQMNINTYGKFASYDYEHDGHIWKTIENINSSTNDTEFNKNKELLLFYISLMLKQDWERSKAEIIGFPSAIKIFFMFTILFIVIGIYYFVVWNSRNILQFFLIIFISIFLPIVYKVYFIDGLIDLNDYKKIVKLKKAKKNNRKSILVMITFSFSIILTFFFLITWLNISLCDNVLKNMSYKLYDDRIELYTNLNDEFLFNFGNVLEKKIDINVIIVSKDDGMDDFSSMPKNISDNVKEVVKTRIEVFNNIIFMGYVFFLFYIMFLIIVSNEKNVKYDKAIKKAKLFIAGEYIQQIYDAYSIIQKVIEFSPDNEKKNEVNELLDLEYTIFCNIQRESRNKFSLYKYNTRSLAEYNLSEQYRANLMIVKECIAILKLYLNEKTTNGKIINLKNIETKLRELVTRNEVK